jgi:hypothetical protein
MKVNKFIMSLAAVVVAAVRDTAENPDFIYSEPVFKFCLGMVLEKGDGHPGMGKQKRNER